MTDTDAFGQWRQRCRDLLHQSAGEPSRGQSSTRRQNYPRIQAYSMTDGWFGKKEQGVSQDSGRTDKPASVASDPDSAKRQLSAFEELLDQDYSDDEDFVKKRDQVEAWKDELLRTSPMVRFMTKQLAFVGCSPFADRRGPDERVRFPPFLITRCTAKGGTPRSLGGFAPPGPDMDITESGIVLCAEAIRSKKELEHVFSHEMMHWYDSCRFKVDFTDLRHVAATEVRASMLSGECSYGNESTRLGTFLLGRAHFKDCVRRRATASVAMNPHCKNEATAARVVDEVFSSAINDTRPFDEIYA